MKPISLLLAVPLVLTPLPAVEAEPHELTLVADESWVLATTGTAGLFGFLGHPHAILATELEARICHIPEDLGSSWVELEIPTASLVIDSPAALERAGMSRSVDEQQQRELTEKMLGERFLSAQQHPAIVFRSTGVEEGSEGRWQLRGELTLRGVSREVELPVEVDGEDDGRMTFRGELTIEHRQFAMEPESIAGVVKVAEKIDLELHWVARATERPCPERSQEGEEDGAPADSAASATRRGAR